MTVVNIKLDANYSCIEMLLMSFTETQYIQETC